MPFSCSKDKKNLGSVLFQLVAGDQCYRIFSALRYWSWP